MATAFTTDWIWRPRSFAYDSLGRLLTATNPESGIITYGYDAVGNLTSKTAPAPNQSGGATVTTNYTQLISADQVVVEPLDPRGGVVGDDLVPELGPESRNEVDAAHRRSRLA